VLFRRDLPLDARRPPRYLILNGMIEAEITLSFTFESRTVKFVLSARMSREGVLAPEDRSWLLRMADVRRVDPEALADLLVDAYDIVAVMGS